MADLKNWKKVRTENAGTAASTDNDGWQKKLFAKFLHKRLSTVNNFERLANGAGVQGDCATLGNLRYFVKQSASLDLTSSNQHKDAAYGDNR